MTAGKRIRRTQIAIDTSGQLALFGGLREEARPRVEPAAGVEPALRFVQPDPRRIVLGAKRLDEHLQAMKIRWPFVVVGLLAEQDWSPFMAQYSPEGRPGYAPQPMVGLVVAGLMKGVDTLRGLEELARSDLGVMWVTGGICPDHSVIGRFLLLHAETLSEAFFAGLTASVLRATGSGTSTLAVDGTVIAAAAARAGTLRAEALRAALDKAEAAAEQAPVEVEVEVEAAATTAKLVTAQAALAERIAARAAKGKDAKGLSIHPDEPEAVVQPQKDKTFAPSYKPSVLANGARVVVAGAVHASSETAVVERLLDQAQLHGKVDTLLGDAGFNAAGVIESAAERDVELLAPEGRTLPGEASTSKKSDKQTQKSAFVYAAASDSYRCPAGHSLHRIAATGDYTLYGGAPCTGCPLRSACTRSAAGRQIKRYACDAAKEAMRAKLAEPAGRKRYNQRAGMVEPVFAHLKQNQGLRRFRRRGLAKVRLEFMLHLAAYNLARAVALAPALARLFGCILAALLGRLVIPRQTQAPRLRARLRAVTMHLIDPLESQPGAIHV